MSLQPTQFGSGGDGWGSLPEGYTPPRRADQASQRHSDVLVARHAQSLAGESALRGGDHYRPGYKGKRDPMAHFYGPHFHEDKASDDLKDWWHSTGQHSIRHENFRPERQS